MSEQTIWNALRNGGFSEEGTAGVMGNLYCKSLLKSTNVEDRSGINDDIYTQQVDNGVRSKASFAHDTYGYGLAQWTYYTRKEGLYDLAKSKGVSIGDEEMQVEWLISELSGYPSLLSYLKTTTDVSTASNRVCSEFERPAVNNFEARYKKAQEYYNKYKGTVVVAKNAATTSAITASANVAQAEKTEDVDMPVLSKGSVGIPVGMVQYALKERGYSLGAYGIDYDFGTSTQMAVNMFKTAKGINNVGTNYGVVDGKTWSALME